MLLELLNDEYYLSLLVITKEKYDFLSKVFIVLKLSVEKMTHHTAILPIDKTLSYCYSSCNSYQLLIAKGID